MILTRTNRRAANFRSAGFAPESVMTIHKSKGLEFPVVFLDLVGGWSGSERGASSRERREREDEEIRITYVGASRAENLLVVLKRPVYDEGDTEKERWERLFRPHTQSVSLPDLAETQKREAEARSTSA